MPIIVIGPRNLTALKSGSGDTVLVLAYRDADGKFSTHIYCARTKPFDEARPDIYFLRELLARKPEPRIYGSVVLRENSRETPLAKIRIVAQKRKRKYFALTDKNGLYRFQNLPDGDYKIYLELPKEYEPDWSPGYLEGITLQKNAEPRRAYFKSFGPSAFAGFAVAKAK